MYLKVLVTIINYGICTNLGTKIYDHEKAKTIDVMWAHLEGHVVDIIECFQTRSRSEPVKRGGGKMITTFSTVRSPNSSMGL